MPNRIIRESARTSPTLDALSHGAERMWWRLTTLADDYGRFDADPRVLLAGCFPLRVGRGLTPAKIAAWLQEVVKAGGVRLYEVDGRGYGVFTNWDKHQRRRDSKPKFPDPPQIAAVRGESPPSREPLDVRREAGGGNGTNGDVFTRDQIDKTRAWVQSIRRTPSNQREKRTKEAISELRWLLKVPEDKIRSLMVKVGEEM